MKSLFSRLLFSFTLSLSLLYAQQNVPAYDFAKLRSTPKSDVYMQAFYWNPPPGGIWYDSLARLAPRLASAGFGAVWYPPPEKGASGGFSMGYDPYDHFDFGEFDQKGSLETRFGSRQELVNSINTFHNVGMQVFADAVMRHMNGGEQLEPYECKPYPSYPDSSWMLFQYPYGSGRFKKTQADFVPNYQVCDVNVPYHGPSDPIYRFGEWLSHDKQSVRDSLIVWGQYMRNVLGFDGFRLDAVKNIDPYFMALWLQGANSGGYAVAEYFGGTSEIGDWLNQCKNIHGGSVAMFDFPLRYTLKDMCNNTSGGFLMTNLDGAGLVHNGVSGFDVSTFVENHDMDRTQYDGTYANGHDPILTNKDMAYAYTIFSEGRPCVWFRDYFAYGLAGKIDTLIWIRMNILYGGTTQRSGLNPSYVGGDGNQTNISHDIYVARRDGGNGKPEAYLVINDNPTQWLGVWVNTTNPNKVFRDYIGRAIDKTAANDGRVDLWAPPRGYAIYVPDTTQHVNDPPYILTTPDLTAFTNTPYSYQVQGGDPNNSSLNYSATGNPSWLSISPSGLLTGTPTSSDTGTTQLIVTVTDPLALTATDTFNVYVSNHPMMDGKFEGTGIWGAPFAVADTIIGWDSAQVKNIYVTEDAQYYYFGADVRANTPMDWAFLIMSKYGGGSSESWSRNIVYAHRDLPDYILRGNFGGYAELHSRDFAWWNGTGSPLNSSEFAENISQDTLIQDGWVEGRVLKSSLGNPTGFGLQFYLTGSQNGNATFDACPDDSNTTVETGITTSLRNYKKYGTIGASFSNLQWPPSGFINLGGSHTVYSRIYALEVTDSTGQGNGITAWIGYDTANTNPAIWTNWLSATYNVDVGTLDEYSKTFGSTLPKGVYFYASRFQLNGGAYLYGGYSTNGGGMWDGTTNVSGALFVEMPPLAASLTYPADSAVDVPKTVNMQWGAAQGATTYRLQVYLDSNFATKVVDDSTLSVTNKNVTLSNLAHYYWRVIGKNTSGWGAWSAIHQFTTVIAAPSTPTLQLPASGSVNQPLTVQLQWSTSPTATSYMVLISTDSLFTHVVENDTVTSTTLSTDTLSNYTTYYWRVRAMNVGVVSAVSSVWKFKTIVAAPSTPSLVTPVQGATNLFTSLRLYWSNISTAETYRLVVASDTNFTIVVNDDSTVTDTSKQVNGLSPNTKYFWKVRSKNVAGLSSYTTSRSFTTANVITNQYAVQKSWNLLSIPLATSNGIASSLFPTAVSPAFSFKQGAGYISTDTLLNGVGYWVKFADTQNVSIAGLTKSLDTITVTLGWNLVGSLSSNVNIASIIQILSGIVISSYYQFAIPAGYTSAITLLPMKGYWVKTNSAGKLVLQSGSEETKAIGINKKK